MEWPVLHERIVSEWWKSEALGLSREAAAFALEPRSMVSNSAQVKEWLDAQAAQLPGYVKLRQDLAEIFAGIAGSMALQSQPETKPKQVLDGLGNVRQTLLDRLENVLDEALLVHKRVLESIRQRLLTNDSQEPQDAESTDGWQAESDARFNFKSLQSLARKFESSHGQSINWLRTPLLLPQGEHAKEPLDLNQLVAESCGSHLGAAPCQDQVPVKVNRESVLFALEHTRSLMSSWQAKLFDRLLFQFINLAEWERLSDRETKQRPAERLVLSFLRTGLSAPRASISGAAVQLWVPFEGQGDSIPLELKRDLQAKIELLNNLLKPQGLILALRAGFEQGLEIELRIPGVNWSGFAGTGKLRQSDTFERRMLPPGATVWYRGSCAGALPMELEFPGELLLDRGGRKALFDVLVNLEQLLFGNRELSRVVIDWYLPKGEAGSQSPAERVRLGNFQVRCDAQNQSLELRWAAELRKILTFSLPGELTRSANEFRSSNAQGYPGLILDGTSLLKEKEWRESLGEMLRLVTPIGCVNFQTIARHLEADAEKENFGRSLVQLISGAARSLRKECRSRPTLINIHAGDELSPVAVTFMLKSGMPVAHLLVDRQSGSAELFYQGREVVDSFMKRFKEAVTSGPLSELSSIRNLFARLNAAGLEIPDALAIRIHRSIVQRGSRGLAAVSRMVWQELKNGSCILRPDHHTGKTAMCALHAEGYTPKLRTENPSESN